MTSPALLAVPQQLLHKSHSNNTISIPYSSSFASSLFAFPSLLPVTFQPAFAKAKKSTRSRRQQKPKTTSRKSTCPFFHSLCLLPCQETHTIPAKPVLKEKEKKRPSLVCFPHSPKQASLAKKKAKREQDTPQTRQENASPDGKKKKKKEQKDSSRKHYSRLGFDPAPCFFLQSFNTFLSLFASLVPPSFLIPLSVLTCKKQKDPNNNNNKKTNNDSVHTFLFRPALFNWFPLTPPADS
jgi:hypothetical protein